MKHLYFPFAGMLSRRLVALLVGLLAFTTSYGQCSINLGADTAFCQNDSIVLDAGPGFVNYLWSGGHNGQKLTVKNPGLYTVLAVDASSCVARDTIFISVNLLPQVNLGNDTTICDRDFVLLNAGSGFKHYHWNNGDTTATVFGILTGGYKVVVTDTNGCSNYDSMHLTVNPTPVVNLGNDTAICFGNAVLLDAGSGMDTYNWSTGEQTQTITANGNMKYRVDVENSYGCTASDSLNLTVNLLPQVNIGVDQTICANEKAEFEATLNMARYQWSTGDTVYAARTGTAGLISVTITDNNGCKQSDTAEVFVRAIPSVDLGPDQIICKGSTLNLDAGAGMTSYSWNTGETSQTINISDSGWYAVEVSDTACFNTDTIFIDMYPSIPVVLGNDTGICQGNTLTLDAGAGFDSYVWSTGEQTRQITVNADGEYRVVARDGNDCLTRDTIEVTVKSLPDASFTAVLQGGKTVDFEAVNTAAISYDWDFGDTQSGTGQTVSHTYAADGSYEVILTVSDGECSDTTMQDVAVTTLGIAKNNANKLGIQAYPNPSPGVIQVTVPVGQPAMVQLQLADMTGRIYPVTSQQAAAGNWTYTMDTRSLGLAAGVYLLRVNVQGKGTSAIQLLITE